MYRLPRPHHPLCIISQHNDDTPHLLTHSPSHSITHYNLLLPLPTHPPSQHPTLPSHSSPAVTPVSPTCPQQSWPRAPRFLLPHHFEHFGPSHFLLCPHTSLLFNLSRGHVVRAKPTRSRLLDPGLSPQARCHRRASEISPAPETTSTPPYNYSPSSVRHNHIPSHIVSTSLFFTRLIVMPTDAMARPSALTLGPNSSFASPGFGGRAPRSPLDRPRTSPLRSSSLRSEISSDSDGEEEDQSATSSTSSNDSNDSVEERRPFALPQRTTRVRFSPMTPANPSANKSQPLARALLNRALTPNNAQPKKTTKIIVPTKTIRTTFELGLTSNELARKQ